MFETLPAGTELRVWGTPPDERDGRDKILRGGGCINVWFG